MTVMRAKVTKVGGTEMISVTVDGELYTASPETHPNYDEIKRLAKAKDLKVLDLFDEAQKAGMQFAQLSDRMVVRDRRLYWDGDVVDHSLARQILRFMAEGLDFKPLVNFYDKVSSNPSDNSRKQLFGWLNSHHFVITEAGDIVGHKGMIRLTKDEANKTKYGDKEFRSTSSGTAYVNDEQYQGFIPCSVGDVVSMPRSTVADNPNAECSTGLHIGNPNYAKKFGDTIVQVLINPRDVCSVPRESAEKMRVCRYFVQEIVTKQNISALVKGAPKWEPENDAPKPARQTPTKAATKREAAPSTGDILADERTTTAAPEKPKKAATPRKGSIMRKGASDRPKSRSTAGTPTPKINWNTNNLAKLIKADTDAKLQKAFPGANLSTLKRRRAQALKDQGK
jgi:hypothetical protein